MNRDVQIIGFSIFGPCCDDVIASALVQYKGPCNNGNEDVEEMSKSVKTYILSWKLTLRENISYDLFSSKHIKGTYTVLKIEKKNYMIQFD